MQLIEDVKLAWGTEAWSTEKYLRINSGVVVRRGSRFDRLADHMADSFSTGAGMHLYGCYQPKIDWRVLTPEERAGVVGITDGDAMHNTVQVFELPAALLQRIRQHVEDCLTARQFGNYSDAQVMKIEGEAMRPLCGPLRHWLLTHICEPFESDESHDPFIRINPPGRNSATGFELRGWDGLHIDHWGGNNWLQGRRTYNGSRFILNVGEETRHLVYINLRLATIATRCAQHISPEIHAMLMCRECQMTGLMANAFMESCPDYPVLRVTLPPGFGYINNSVAVPHDGYLVGKIKQDIALLIPHQINSKSDHDEALKADPIRYRREWKERCLEMTR